VLFAPSLDVCGRLDARGRGRDARFGEQLEHVVEVEITLAHQQLEVQPGRRLVQALRSRGHGGSCALHPTERA
jgi:hypothetical protein